MSDRTFPKPGHTWKRTVERTVTIEVVMARPEYEHEGEVMYRYDDEEQLRHASIAWFVEAFEYVGKPS